jgi:CheY-like chemotaxis protein
VDDEPDIAAFIADALSLEGYSVRTATSGHEALEHVSASMPALILLDLRMPEMTGWDFARAYHERFAGETAAPIIVMTAAIDAPEQAAETWISGSLPKPFDLNQLFNVVARVIGTPPTTS